MAGYEQDVGSKTTMRLFYPESAHFNPKVEDNPDTLLVLVAFKAMDFHWIESILSDKKRVRGETGRGAVSACGGGTLPGSGPPAPSRVPQDPQEPVRVRRELSVLPQRSGNSSPGRPSEKPGAEGPVCYHLQVGAG